MDGEEPMRSISLVVTEGQPGAYGADANNRHDEEPAAISLSPAEFLLVNRYRCLPRELQASLDSMLQTLAETLPDNS